MESWKLALLLTADIPVFWFVGWLYFGSLSDILDAVEQGDPVDEYWPDWSFLCMKIGFFLVTCLAIFWAEYAWLSR